MFGPGADPAAYAAYWGKQLGFSGSEPEQELGVRGVKSRRRFDEAQKLHHEYTSWSSAKGPIVVAYLGLDGTYQWNRPHFVDFVRAIQER